MENEGEQEFFKFLVNFVKSFDITSEFSYNTLTK